MKVNQTTSSAQHLLQVGAPHVDAVVTATVRHQMLTVTDSELALFAVPVRTHTRVQRVVAPEELAVWDKLAAHTCKQTQKDRQRAKQAARRRSYARVALAIPCRIPIRGAQKVVRCVVVPATADVPRTPPAQVAMRLRREGQIP